MTGEVRVRITSARGNMDFHVSADATIDNINAAANDFAERLGWQPPLTWWKPDERIEDGWNVYHSLGPAPR